MKINRTGLAEDQFSTGNMPYNPVIIPNGGPSKTKMTMRFMMFVYLSDNKFLPVETISVAG